MAFCAPPAHADEDFTYDINFTCDPSTPSCLLPTSGTFTYDSTTDEFTNFEVVWDGISINLKDAANAGPISPLEGTNSCLGSSTGGAASYLLMTACPLLSPYEPWLANTGGDFAFTESYDVNDYAAFRAGIPGLPGNAPQAYGDFTLTAVPEPGAYVLLLTMIGLVLLTMRKTITRGL